MPRKMIITQVQLQRYIKRWAGRKTRLEMEDETGVSGSHIINTAIALGLSLKLKEDVKRLEMTIKAIQEHKDTLTCSEIAGKIGVVPSSVFYHARKLGIELRKPNQKKVVVASNNGLFNYRERSNWLI